MPSASPPAAAGATAAADAAAGASALVRHALMGLVRKEAQPTGLERRLAIELGAVLVQLAPCDDPGAAIQSQLGGAEAATRGLGACLQLVQDGEAAELSETLLPQLAQALGAVFELSRLLGHRTTASGTLSGGQNARRAHAPVPSAFTVINTRRSFVLPRHRRGADEAASASPAHMHLAELASLYRRMVSVAGGESWSWTDARKLELALVGYVEALAWIGADAVEQAVDLACGPRDAGEAFAGALLLLTIGGRDTAMLALGSLAGLPVAARAGVITAARHAPHPDASAALLGLHRDHPETRAVLLPALIERGLIGAAELTAYVREKDEQLVVAAASGLVRLGARPSEAVLARVVDDTESTKVRGAVLSAAARLGAGWALDELRGLPARELNPELVRALAVAGGPADLRLLADVARIGGATGRVAAAALGWIGTPAAVPPLLELGESEEVGMAARWGLRELTGGAAMVGGRPQDRLLRGRQWTPVAAVQRLADPELPLVWADAAAAELALKLRAPGPIPEPQASATLQRACVEWWRAAFRAS